MGKTAAQLKKELDRTFSVFIRVRDSRPNDTGRCCTCGTPIHHWLDAEAGHYISRTYTATRWDERNVHLQCVACNRYHGGSPHQYRDFLLFRYGEEVVAELERKKNEVVKLDTQWLEAKILLFKRKTNEIFGKS